MIYNVKLFSSLNACCGADSSSEITMQPQPTEKEIQFILDAIAEYLTVKVSWALVCITLMQLATLHTKTAARCFFCWIVCIGP